MSSPIQSDISNVTCLFIDNNERLKRLLGRIEDFSPKINEFHILGLQTPIYVLKAGTTSNASRASPDESDSQARPINSPEEIRKITTEMQALTRDIQAAMGNIRTLGDKNQELIIKIDAYTGTIGSLSQSLNPYRGSFVAYARSVLAVLSAVRPRTSILSRNIHTLASTVTSGGLHLLAGSLEASLCRDIQTLAASLQDLTQGAIVYMRSVCV